MKDKIMNEQESNFADRERPGIRGEELPENAEDGFFLLDREWRFSYINKKAAGIAGKRAADLTGKVIWEEHPSLIGTGLEAAYRTAMEKRVIRRFETRGADTVTWYNVFAIPSAEGITVYWQDISSQKEKEEEAKKANAELAERTRELQVQRQRLLDMLETLPVMVRLMKPDHRIVFSNRAFLGKFGEPGGRRCHEYFCGNDTPCPFCEAFVPLETGKPHHWELNYPDGSMVLDIYDFPFSDADGSPLVLEMDIDITERKKAEEERDRFLTEIDMQRGRLQAIVDSLPIGLWISDAGGKMTFINDNARLIYGGKAPYAKSVAEYDEYRAWWADSGEKIAAEDMPMARALRGETMKEAAVEFLRFDGTRGTQLVSTGPIKDSKGNLQGCVAVVTDITERKRAEEALRESETKANDLVRKLEEADRNKNQFISALSHELRNPLASISAGVDLIEISDDKERQEKAREILRRQIKQLKRLIDDLLDISLISQNKTRLQKEKVILNEIVKNTAADFKPEFEKRGIALYTKIQVREITLSADAVRIAQMIGNLLANSLKFTQKGGVVWLTVCKKKNGAVITVKDNGTGISSEILPNLFKPFTQAEQALDRRDGGLGLGLSIVKGIAELHGGSVSVYSAGAGKGCEFTVRLPVFEAENKGEYT